LDTLFSWDIVVALKHAALNVDGAAHCVNNANEFHQHPISRGFNNSTTVFCYLGIDQFSAMCFELPQRAFFIGTHQSAVTGDVGCKNRRKPSIDAVFGHGGRPG
jgi:hypothetical protein